MWEAIYLYQKIKRKMATITYRISGTKNPSEIRVRFRNGRNVDYNAGTKIFIDPKYWDEKNQKIKNVIAVPDRDKLNTKLAELKLRISSAANLDFTEGEIFSRIWLENTIAKYYNRPGGELKKLPELHKIYFSDFNDWWMKEKALKYKVAANKYMSKETIQHYSICNDQIKLFEGKNKLKFSDINENTIDNFSEFISEKGYATKTAQRMIGRFKFFCGRAEAENIVIDQSYKNRVFVEAPKVDYKEPYFDEFQINQLYEHDFSKNAVLDNARDNLIIGLWTGLRVSDFNNKLKIDNFDEDFIEIQTEKTSTWVSIPIHWMIKGILNKRKGALPEKVSDQKFNKHIKTIAEILKFDKMMMGGVAKTDPVSKIKRKVVKLYHMYELITSHICRRSFATNNYGTVPNSTLMAICGWKSEEQMLDYIKKTNREHAKVLKKVWDNKYKQAN